MSFVDDTPNDLEPEPVPEQMSTDVVVTKLAQSGMAPEVIAITVGIPIAHVRSVVRISRGLSPVEQQLQEDVRMLASMAVKQAARILQFGPTEQKLRVITSLLGHTARLIGTGDGVGSNELRDQLEELFGMQRVVPASHTVLTDAHVIDVQATNGAIVDATVNPAQPIPVADIPSDAQPPLHQPPLIPPPPSPPTFPQPIVPNPSVPPMPASDPRNPLAAALKTLIETANDQDEVFGTAEVRY